LIALSIGFRNQNSRIPGERHGLKNQKFSFPGESIRLEAKIPPFPGEVPDSGIFIPAFTVSERSPGASTTYTTYMSYPPLTD
jgi:hypothetical protein